MSPKSPSLVSPLNFPIVELKGGKRFELDADQKDIVTQIVKMLREFFPDVDSEDIAAKIISPALTQRLPKWAEQDGYQLGYGTIFNSGAFCVYWGKDEETGQIVTLLHTRKEKNEKQEHLHGTLGGYTSKEEQAIVGLARETGQEVCDDKGKPVFEPEQRNYVLMVEGKDFNTKSGIPVQYTGYSYELSPAEIKVLKAYDKRMAEDETYRSAVRVASDDETHGLQLVPLKQVVEMSPDDFKYHRHYDLYREVASRLGMEEVARPTNRISETKVEPRKPHAMGFTIGESVELGMARRTYSNDGKMTRYAPDGVTREGQPITR